MFRDKAIRIVVDQPCRILNETKVFDANGNVIEYDETKVAEEEKRLQAEYDANQYKRDRQQEYPSLQECIHAILDNDLETLQAKRTAVKTKYPKPSE